MKAFIFGAAGIIGQHMRLCVPEGVEPVWFRSKPDLLHRGFDLTADMGQAMAQLLNEERPAIIINLAGENRPDVVQQHPELYRDINVGLPAVLSHWCHYNDCHYVHVSSQAVYGGDAPYKAGPEAKPPYSEDSVRLPMNAYGAQKLNAETEVMAAGKAWSIARPTFVLGVRPLPLVGRENPVEQWLGSTDIVVESQSTARLRAVNNRWFSVSFAWEVAEQLWAMAIGPERRNRRNLGIGYRVSRYDLAKYLNPTVEAVRHEDFKGIAERPADTTYAGEGTWEQVTIGLHNCKLQYQARERMGVYQRAAEISIFTGRPIKECLEKLHRGFGRLHNEVAADWNAANPQTDAEILDWYRKTEAYIWELSSYHLDPGFNYTGMCAGVAEGLKARGASSVLCLGDGIGDLTLALGRANIVAGYHDMPCSKTALFARMRQFMYQGWERSWNFLDPAVLREREGEYDAVVSLDFLEHVMDVEAWVRGIYAALRPGGWLMAQNAFACGSGPDGSIPMHLARNDRFEKDWDPLLLSIGFVQESSNWYRKGE